MDRVSLYQPDVAVDTRALVPPALELRRISPNHERVFAAVIEHVGQIVARGSVAAIMTPEIVSVDGHFVISIDAVEFHADSPTNVHAGDLENAPVPADACARVVPSERLETMEKELGVIDEIELDGPVVGEIDGLPGAVVEIDCRGREGRTLGRRRRLGEAEVLGRIERMPQVKSPSGIKQKSLPAAGRGRLAGGWVLPGSQGIVS